MWLASRFLLWEPRVDLERGLPAGVLGMFWASVVSGDEGGLCEDEEADWRGGTGEEDEVEGASVIACEGPEEEMGGEEESSRNVYVGDGLGLSSGGGMSFSERVQRWAEVRTEWLCAPSSSTSSLFLP